MIRSSLVQYSAYESHKKINLQSINKQCILHQQSMRIAPDSLMSGFSSPNTFTLSSMPPIPVILRGAKGEVAESILPESTLSQGVWRDRPQRPITLYQSSNSSLQRALSNGTGENACGGLW